MMPSKAGMEDLLDKRPLGKRLRGDVLTHLH